MKPYSSFVLIGIAAAALSGCSALETDKVDYKSAPAKAPPLVVPPDLTQLSKDTRYAVVDGGVSASGTTTVANGTNKVPIAAVSLGDVRIERSGSQRWLVVNRPADALWEPVKDFWQENGFNLAMDQANLGIMETDWAENRAKLPMDFIRNSLGKLIDALYSTPERDKFRTRLERNSDGATEIYISHRGMIEVYTSEGRGATVWQPRPVDPELEAEFLRRLMVKLGVAPEQAKSTVAAAAANKPVSSVATVDGQAAMTINENFDRSWRRVGLALDRTGFTVEDRDRKRGIYFVRYVPLTPEGSEPGFFSKLFSSSKDAKGPVKYQIQVQEKSGVSLVTVLNESGAAETTENAKRILSVLAADIK
ncbi:outer membrane protein assembly factor BamC [Curvibacter sp. APW13]|uniref:outer membrane protein assembly factor BamC n=1 Tax=Curvibacter sp. APW13 TaxID=3077236 RepID=UPI0028DF632A|nr:outer membrane protein assembly factor BamC [Curvibacter sp. APW13]MDT8991021.1 outer membrane protein assembly factor BamC [Curvibacter sp. APW13]